MAKSKKCTRVAFDEVKPGDKVVFNDGRERVTLTIVNFNQSEGDWDVKKGRTETFLSERDFKNGHVFKCKTTKK